MAKKIREGTGPGVPQVVRQINLHAVTHEMRGMEIFSKIDLVRKCGISPTTMAKLFAQLQDGGLIEPSEERDRSLGRPRDFYRLSTPLQIAAVAIGVEYTFVALSGLTGEPSPKYRVKFPTGNDFDRLFDRIEAELRRLTKESGATCRLLGTCIPGLIDEETGVSVMSPNLHMLEGGKPAIELERRMGLPAFCMHDVRALCRAQRMDGEALRDYVAMEFTVGVGMGAVVNGSFLRGADGFAGEIGHVVVDPEGRPCGCGNRGCLETRASDLVLQIETGRSLEEAFDRLAAGDPDVLAIADSIIRAQGHSVAVAINIFNPEKIYVHSWLAEKHPDYLSILTEEAGRLSMPHLFERCKIEKYRREILDGVVLETVDRLIERVILKKETIR